jgi:hypothetical protein
MTDKVARQAHIIRVHPLLSVCQTAAPSHAGQFDPHVNDMVRSQIIDRLNAGQSPSVALGILCVQVGME